MFEFFRAILGISSAYLLPGLAVSFLLFPYGRSLSRIERLILSFGLSPGIVTFLMFLSYIIFNSFNSLFLIASLALVVSLPVILFWFQNRFHRPSMTGSFSEIRDGLTLPKPFMLLFMVITSLILLFRFYQALNFPIVSWDSLTEFAYLGRLYFQVGGIPTITGATLGIHSSANFPPLVPLLYTWLYTVYGSVEELLIKAVSPLYAALTILVTYMFSKMVYKSKAEAWGSVFFLATVPVFMFSAEDCLSDAPVMFYFVSSIFFLYKSIKDNQRRDRSIIASGLLAGLVAWTKYTGLFIVFVVLAIFIAKKLILNKEVFSLRQVLLFFVFFALLGAPWYLRNWLVVGNPVYPHFYQLFGGKDIDPWLMKNSFDAHFARIEEISGLDLSIKSLLLTYVTVFFKVPSFEITDMGPFIGAFSLVGLYFVLKRRDKGGLFMLTWVAVYFVVWRLTISTFLRYLLAILPALAILSSHGLCELYSSITNLRLKVFNFRGASLSTVLKILIFLLILEGAFLPTLMNSVRGYKTWAIVSPFISRDDYLDMRLPGWWKAVEYINHETPPDAVILTYDHSVQYYVNRTIVFVDEPKMKGAHLANNTEEMMSILREYNISYMLDVEYYKGVYPLENRSFLYANLRNSGYFQPVFNESLVTVYVIK